MDGARRCVGRRGRREPGGIASLVRLNRETDGALNADMMVRLGVPFSLAPRIGWGNLADFVRHLGRDSCVYRARNPEEELFASGLHSNAALADLYDLVAEFITLYASAHSGKGRRPNRPKRYPRPWVEDGEFERIGRDPIPVSEFDRWYYGGE